MVLEVYPLSLSKLASAKFSLLDDVSAVLKMVL
jgi:hypothetical protein